MLIISIAFYKVHIVLSNRNLKCFPLFIAKKTISTYDVFDEL